MSKAYLLWAGDYEDACVVGVFTTRELAEEFCKEHLRWEVRIDEMSILNRLPEKVYTHEATAARTDYSGWGEIRVRRLSIPILPENVDEDAELHRHVDNYRKVGSKKYKLVLRAYGVDEEDARMAVSEKRSLFLRLVGEL